MKNQKTKEKISQADFTSTRMDRDEYEGVEFSNCIFPPVISVNLLDCVFVNCNLSNIRFNNGFLQTVTFRDSKLMGVNFSGARDFGLELHFEGCILDYASFDKKKLNKSSFRNCKVHGANFTQSDLSKSLISGCDFYDSVFAGTNLSGADLSTSRNFVIDPELNNIKKAKFNLNSLPGLLQKHQIVVE